MIYFLDTSAILNGATGRYTNFYTSPIVLSELEHIKASRSKDLIIKIKAQSAASKMRDCDNVKYTFYSEKQIRRTIKKVHFLSDINDHKILTEAMLLARELHEKIGFVTSDNALYLFASQIPELSAIYYHIEQYYEEYRGWNDYYPNEEEFANLYEKPQENILKARGNEFCKIYDEHELKDVLFWDGTKYRPLIYKSFTTSLGEKIKPRNTEQKMYLDLLQNENIPIKLCIGRFGSGKSYMALTYALDAVHKGRFNKIVFVKNNLNVKGAGVLGTLPGDEISKQYPWLRQIEDHLGIQKFEEYLNMGIIEPAHLSSLRGRDLKNCIILVDEAENLLATNIQLLLGRVAENSEIIFCADVKQCDYDDESKSGINKMIKCLAGNKLFGMVKLIKSERSVVAAAADLMD